jgi:hypothetical protein
MAAAFLPPSALAFDLRSALGLPELSRSAGQLCPRRQFGMGQVSRYSAHALTAKRNPFARKGGCGTARKSRDLQCEMQFDGNG